MMQILNRLASLKLTLLGMLGVVALALLRNRSPEFDTAWVAVPIAFLSLNLFAAILANHAFRRQAALLVFHVCLLAALLLIGIGILIRFDGHVELVEGEIFDADKVEVAQLGPWHPTYLEGVSFKQGEIEVAYAPGFVRGGTRSVMIAEPSAGRPRNIVTGDRASASFAAYRFITTFNKGLAVIVQWSGVDGSPQRGSINFPSYPEYDWKQVNTWTTPGGEQLRLELKLAAPAGDRAWVLRSRDMPFAVEVSADGGVPQTLRRGDSLRLPNGMLKIDGLRMWMGYRIDFNPLLPWIFAAAFLAVIALAVHFQMKFRPARQSATSDSLEGIRAYDCYD